MDNVKVLSDRTDSRLAWVDNARAIGILLVVYGHITRGIIDAGLAQNDLGLLRAVDSIVYSFHMPLFFFLSGLFFCRGFSQGPRKLIADKIDSVAYPYIIWSVIQGLIEIQFSQYKNHPLGLMELTNVLWAPRAQFWFLYVLFFYFVFLTIFFQVASVKAVRAALIFAIVLYFYQAYFKANSNTFVLAAGCTNISFFVLGIWHSQIYGTSVVISRTKKVILAITFVFAQYIYHVVWNQSYVNYGWAALFLAIISVAFILVVADSLPCLASKVLGPIGTLTMPIFLMHILAGSGARIAMQRLFGVTDTGMHIVIGMAAGVLIPILVATALEKLGVRFAFRAPISALIRFLPHKAHT